MQKIILVLALFYLELPTGNTSETILNHWVTKSPGYKELNSHAIKATDNVGAPESMLSYNTLTNLNESELIQSSYFTPTIGDENFSLASYYNPTSLSEIEPESSYFTPTIVDVYVSLTKYYKPTNSSEIDSLSSDYTHSISKEGEFTSSYFIPTSFVGIESMSSHLVQTEPISSHLVQTYSMSSQIVQTESMSSHFLQTIVSDTHNWSQPYSTASQSQIFTNLAISPTQNPTHSTTYMPIPSTLVYNSIYNISSSTAPALSHPSSSSVKNIPLIAILSSVAIFLVIAFVGLIACLLCRRHRNRRNASNDSIPKTPDSRRIFPFSYLQNPVLRKSSTDSSQPLQTSGKARRLMTAPSNNTEDDYSGRSDTAFNGNKERLETPLPHIKPKTGNFLFGRKRKTVIPLSQKLSVVREEVNDETPMYAVVNTNGKTKANHKNEPYKSGTQGHKDNSNILKDSDLADQQNQTMSIIYTQVPYNEIVWQKSESNSPSHSPSNSSSKNNQVYSHLWDVERNFENPYN